MSRHGEASSAGASGVGWVQIVTGGGPLGRLVTVHAVTAAADAAFTVSLAGSLFFSVSVEAARPRLLVYLAATLAPFALVIPFVGPLVDRSRGGYRTVIAVTAIGRTVVCGLLARHLTTLYLFPEAFGVLVLGKTYSIAKSALVPRLVADQRELVSANARLSRLSTVGGLLGGAAGVAVLHVASSGAVVVMAAVGHASAALLALRLRTPAPVRQPVPVADVVELTSARLGLAANAMTVLRFASGFVTFLVALSLKTASAPAWVYGIVLVAGALGGLVGTVLGPLLRRQVGEDVLLGGSLVVTGVICLFAAAQDRRTSSVLVSVAVGVAAMVGRHAFDATAQRLAPDAEKGRAFARFETRFQLAWVVGAVGPVVARPSGFVGLLVLTAVLAVGALGYVVGQRALRPEPAPPAASDPVGDLLALATALRSQGAPGLAVLTAAEAVRVSSARVGRGGHALPAELSSLWTNVSHGAAASDADAALAIELAEQAWRGGAAGPG